jgi:hypothetical protein
MNCQFIPSGLLGDLWQGKKKVAPFRGHDFKEAEWRDVREDDARRHSGNWNGLSREV